MQERNVGKSGLRVSAIGLGCNNFGRPVDFDGSRAVIHKALSRNPAQRFAGVAAFRKALVKAVQEG